MTVLVQDSAPDTILALLNQLDAEPNVFGPEFEDVDLGDWASVHVYLPTPLVNSSMTPPFMEAFLVLQKQVYQLAALAKAGVADVGQLGDVDRRELEISVIVSGGSSDYVAKLAEPLQALLKRLVGKMTGKQAAIVIVAIAALVAAPSTQAWGDDAAEREGHRQVALMGELIAALARWRVQEHPIRSAGEGEAGAFGRVACAGDCTNISAAGCTGAGECTGKNR